MFAKRNPFKKSEDKKDEKKSSSAPTSQSVSAACSPTTSKVTPTTSKVKEKPKEAGFIYKPDKLTEYHKKKIENWTNSINSLLSDEEGILAFEQFLKEAETEPGELCRYINFYRECNEYRKKCIALEEEANRIFENYLEIGSNQEIGTDGKAKEVEEKLSDGFPQKTLFQEAQQKVKDQLNNTLYTNFKLDLLEYIKKHT